jgi:hypothetical protein
MKKTVLALIIVLTAILGGCSLTGQLVVPGPPNNLGIVNVSSSAITIGWIDNSMNEKGFTVERKSGTDGVWLQLAEKNENVTFHGDNLVSADSKYYYRIRSYNDAGYSPYSSEISVYTLPSAGITKEPSLTITSPFDQATITAPFSISFEVEDWDVEVGDSRPTHLHWFLNDVNQGAHFQLTDISSGNIGPGFYTISLRLANKDHDFIGVNDTIEVTVTN